MPILVLHLDGEERELAALLGLSSLSLVIVMLLFLAVTWVCLQYVIVVFPDHTQLLFLLPILKRRISIKKARFDWISLAPVFSFIYC